MFASLNLVTTLYENECTEPYTVEQMRFLVQSLNRIENPQDRAYLALHALHPLRLEEVLALKEKDIDLIENTIHIEKAVTHPARNQPLIKDTKTEASRRTINLVPEIRQISNLKKSKVRISRFGLLFLWIVSR